MAKFSEFHEAFHELVKSFENVHLKVEENLEADIIKIFGEKISALSRAQNGLEDTMELALSTAEHHPYWNVLYHSCQISKSILDKWEEDLSKEEIDEIEWSIKELRHSLEKIKKQKENQKR